MKILKFKKGNNRMLIILIIVFVFFLLEVTNTINIIPNFPKISDDIPEDRVDVFCGEVVSVICHTDFCTIGIDDPTRAFTPIPTGESECPTHNTLKVSQLKNTEGIDLCIDFFSTESMTEHCARFPTQDEIKTLNKFR